MNTQKTVNKAVKDTNAEVNRSKEKLLETAIIPPTSTLSPTPEASLTPASPTPEASLTPPASPTPEASVAPPPSPTPEASFTPARALVSKDVAVAEIEKFGNRLKDARAGKIEAEGEKRIANGINVTLIAAILGGIVTMATTGLFGRHDRREKFLAAVEREWHLEQQGFDFATIPNYQRLSRPKTEGGAVDGQT